MSTRIGLLLLVPAVALAACKSDKQPAEAQKPPAPAADKQPAADRPAAELPPPPASTLLAEGAPAPDISGKTWDGQEISLAALRGKPVVVYFYPKDETPGCIVEAQSFRDDSAEFEALGAVVIGVSMDGPESHQAFAEKHGLKFPLLSDSDGAIAAKFGVDTSRGVAKRTTFVIGKDGKIVKVFAQVQVDGHSDEVLAAVKAAAAG